MALTLKTRTTVAVLAFLALIAALASLSLVAVQRNAVLFEAIAVHDHEARFAVVSLVDDLDAMRLRIVSVMAELDQAPRVANRVPPAARDIRQKWQILVTDFPEMLTPEVRDRADQALGQLDGFADRLRRAFQTNDRAQVLQLHLEWQRIDAGLRGAASVVEDRIRSNAAEAVAEALALERQLERGLTLAVVIGLGLAGFVWWMIANGVVRPVRGTARALAALANGDTSTRFPGVDRRDEIGEMAAAAEILRERRAAAHALAVDMMRSAEQVATAADQAAAAVGQVATGAVDQLHQLQRFGVGLGQTSAAIVDVSDATRVTSVNARNASDAVQVGQGGISQMITTVRDIAQHVARVSAITDDIRRIAVQTNMLSLNAAIEAARAGDAGRGFSVVAEQVRKLAASSADLARGIAEIASASEAKSLNGVSLAESVGEGMVEIASAVAETERVAHAIATAMEEQRATMTGLTDGVRTLERIGQSTASAAEEISTAMNDLVKLAARARAQAQVFARE
jgi:methyl-accepting chemotaxis protein